MKKLISLVLALMLVIALAVPSFCADDDPSVGGGKTYIYVIGSGTNVIVEYRSTGGEPVVIINGITLSGADYSYTDSTIAIKSSYLDKLSAGTYPLVVDSTENTLIVRAASSSTPAPGGKSSPQTGNSAVIWSICGVAALGLAGICFVSARKKSNI